MPDEPNESPDDVDPEEGDERFAQEYLLDSNSTQAYLRAFGSEYFRGGKWIPWSYKAVRAEAAKLLASPNVQLALRRLRRQRAKTYAATHQRIALELGYAAFADIGDVFDARGAVKPLRKMQPTTRKAVQKIKKRRRVIAGKDGEGDCVVEEVEVEMVPKLPALDKLAKHTGFYNEQDDLTNLLNSLPPRLQQELRKAVQLELVAQGKAPQGVSGSREASDQGSNETSMCISTDKVECEKQRSLGKNDVGDLFE